MRNARVRPHGEQVTTSKLSAKALKGVPVVTGYFDKWGSKIDAIVLRAQR